LRSGPEIANTTSVLDRITELFAHALNVDVPSAETDLFDTGVLDSLAFVELLLHLEREFGIKIAVDDLEVDNFRSLRQIAAFVTERTAARPPARSARLVAIAGRRMDDC